MAVTDFRSIERRPFHEISDTARGKLRQSLQEVNKKTIQTRKPCDYSCIHCKKKNVFARQQVDATLHIERKHKLSEKAKSI
jgi:hypothetical protein